jgi:hypothetical protein
MEIRNFKDIYIAENWRAVFFAKWATVCRAWRTLRYIRRTETVEPLMVIPGSLERVVSGPTDFGAPIPREEVLPVLLIHTRLAIGRMIPDRVA